MILTSISPFGQEGPRKDWKASDLVCMAMGGFLHLCGDPDRPPVGVSLPHGYFFAGADAAVGTMIAYYHREQTRSGAVGRCLHTAERCHDLLQFGALVAAPESDSGA